MEFARRGGRLVVRAKSDTAEAFCLQSAGDCRAPAAVQEIEIPLPPVEIDMPHGLPLDGAETGQIKAVSEVRSAAAYEVRFAAPGGTEWELPVRFNRAGVRVSGAEVSGARLKVRVPAAGSVEVRFRW